MLGIAAKLLGGGFHIATGGRRLSMGVKAGIGLGVTGGAIKSIAGSDQYKQYEIARYGRAEVERRGMLGTPRAALGALGTLGVLGGIGVGIGGGRMIGKIATGSARMSMGIAGRAGTLGARGGKALYRSASSWTPPAPHGHLPGPGTARNVTRTVSQGARQAYKSASTWTPPRPHSPLPKRNMQKVLSKGKSMAVAGARGIGGPIARVGTRPIAFARNHPFITAGLIGAVPGMGAGYARAIRSRKMPEGRITAIRSAPGGGIAPSLQYANVQSLFKRMHRNSSRVVR